VIELRSAQCFAFNAKLSIDTQTLCYERWYWHHRKGSEPASPAPSPHLAFRSFSFVSGRLSIAGPGCNS